MQSLRCDDAPDDCCAYFTDTFEIGLVSAKLNPYKDPQNPWDWDGDVPNALLNALDILAYLVPETEVFSEVADAVDEFAPELLEGTVPPDPYFQIVMGTDVVQSSGKKDTYEPVWNEGTAVRFTDKPMYIFVYDEDLLFDCDVPEGLAITEEDAAHFAGGSWVLYHWGKLFELTFYVNPVP